MSAPEQRGETGGGSEPRRNNRPSLLQGLWSRIRRNLGLKILAFLIAVSLWSFVNAGQRSALETIQVPVSYHSLPAGLAIVNHPAGFVNVQVMGPRTLLSLLDPEHLVVKLDLSSIGAGQASFKITPSMFDVPRQVSVTGVSPSQVILDVDKIIRRDVPVHIDVEGEAAQGYKVQTTEVTPKTVRVIGPSKYVNALPQLETDPVNVTGANATFSRGIEIKTPRIPGVVLSTVRVQAKVDIVEKIGDREFHNIGVVVKGTDFKYEIEPKTGAVTLRGPVPKLEQVNSDGLLYVNAANLAPGLHFVSVQVNLPNGTQVVRQSVNKVKLIIDSEKVSSGTGG